MTLLRWFLILGCLLALMAPLLAEDDEEDGGGSTLDPKMMWMIAEKAWNNRQYDDFAVVAAAYAAKGPDEDNALEASWRVFEVYRAYRPNKTKQQDAYEKAMAACDRWIAKYNTSNQNRAASAYWYKAMLQNNNDGRHDQAIGYLNTLVKKYPNSNSTATAYWYLGEWLREYQRYAEAAPNYAAYRKLAGVSEQSGMAAFYEGWCDEALGDREGAKQCYQLVAEDKAYNFAWWQVGNLGLDAARRLKKMGEPDLARKMLIRIIDGSPADWDCTKQANIELGEKPPMKIYIYPHLYHSYSANTVNITGTSKLDYILTTNLLIRTTYVTKDAPFKATLLVTPKVEMTKTPDNMKPAEGDNGAKAFSNLISTTDYADLWHNSFITASKKMDPPDNLIISRKWERQGDTWGNFELRVQSSARWHIYIYLPNAKTNTNNLSTQPNEVRDGGRTFRWYDWYDLTQGMTIKLPIEVGANVSEYYPKIFLEHYGGAGYPDKSANEKEAVYDSMKELKIKLTSTTPFSYYAACPPYTSVTLGEVSK